MPRKLDPNGRTYRRLEAQVALSYANVRQCQKCWRPYIAGYCCINCGDTSPTRTKEQDAAWERQYARST